MTDTLTPPAASIREWNNPEGVAPRGTLIVIPGRGEHPSLYERFGARLASDAYRVRAVADPTRTDSVAAQVADLLADADLPAPKVLVGSDAGALFAIALVAGGRVRVDALILTGLPTRRASSSTAIVADWDAEVAARTACTTHQGRLRSNTDVAHGAVTTPPPAQWFDDADPSAIDVPILAIHGADDTISPLDEARHQYARAGRLSLVTIEGGKHDALNDATHRSAAATIVLFLERLRLGADLPVIAQTAPLSASDAAL